MSPAMRTYTTTSCSVAFCVAFLSPSRQFSVGCETAQVRALWHNAFVGNEAFRETNGRRRDEPTAPRGWGVHENTRSRASAVAFPHSAHPLDCLAEDLSISSEVESDVSTTSAAKCRSGR